MNKPTHARLKRLNLPFKVKLHSRDRKERWVYELRWWDGQKNHRINLDTQNLDAALKARDRLEVKFSIHHRENVPNSQPLAISDFIEQYLRHCLARQLRPNTIRSARSKLNAFQRNIGDVPLDMVTTEIIQDYITAEFDRGRLIRGVWADFRAIRAAFNWAVGDNLIQTNPCNKVDFPKIPRQIPKRFTPREFRSIIERIDRSDDLAIALTFFLTGMRQEEVLSLRWSAIDLVERRIIVTGKGGHEREIPISDLLFEVLSSLPKENEYVFPGYHRRGNGYVPKGRKSASVIRKRFHNYMTDVGITGRGTFHRFRHTTASVLADTGYTELDIGVYLGHANNSVTSGYISMGITRLRKAADDLDRWLKGQLSSDFRPNFSMSLINK